mgnify:CR=1 FL=1
MQKKAQFKNGYTFNRVINGCWQLSAEHCLQGHLDYDDAIRAFHELVEQGFTTFDCADIYTGAEELIGRFGFQCSRDVDKFAGFAWARDINGVPYVTEQCAARFACTVVNEVDLGTHILFVARVDDWAVLERMANDLAAGHEKKD